MKTANPVEPCEYGLIPQMHRERTAGMNACDRTIEPNPGDAKTCYNRGLAHERRGDCVSAINDYDRAISLDPKLAWAYYHRALAHGSRGNRRQQLKDLRAAARLGLRAALDILPVGKKVRK